MYDDNSIDEKKEFKVTIAGFTFGKKHVIIFGIIAVCIVIASIISSVQKAKRDEEARAAALAAAEAARNRNKVEKTVEVPDIHEQIQKQLRKKYGDPPEGFEWGYTGNLVALGNDDESSCEDVVYTYIRALSVLDFSTAERYSSDSTVVKSYKKYYGEITDQITNYYNNFLRKQFKKSLTSIEVNSVTDTSVFSDGTEYVTLNISVLDLTNKDFWRKDKKNLFKQMRVYKESEDDDTKMQQYVYDYIYDSYEKGKIDKKEYTIELVASKDNGKGWLVSGDGELDATLQYEKGVDVAKYILDGFETWYRETTLKEQKQQIKEQQQKIKEKQEKIKKRLKNKSNS